LHVRMGKAIGHNVNPGLELVISAWPDLDRWWHGPLGHAGEAHAEHVLERREPVAPPGQDSAELGIGHVSELDLHRGAAGGEGLLDFAEGGRTGHAAKAKPHDLVERRAFLREARHAAA